MHANLILEKDSFPHNKMVVYLHTNLKTNIVKINETKRCLMLAFKNERFITKTTN